MYGYGDLAVAIQHQELLFEAVEAALAARDIIGVTPSWLDRFYEVSESPEFQKWQRLRDAARAHGR